MGKIKNTFNLNAGFNIHSQEPIDSRIVVEKISDIYDSTQKLWEDTGLYNGLIVASEDGETRVLINRDEPYKEASWKKISGSADIVDVKYSGNTIYLINSDGTPTAGFDASSFVKDGMISNVELNGKKLVITWNTEAGKTELPVDLSSLSDIYTSGDDKKLTISSYKITPVTDKESGLTTYEFVKKIESDLSDKIDNIKDSISADDYTNSAITVNGGPISANGIWENNVIPSGTSIEEILTKLLCQEIYPSKPTLPSISLNGISTGSIYEVGTTINIDAVSANLIDGHFNASFSTPSQPTVGNTFNGDETISYETTNTTYTPANDVKEIVSYDTTVKLGTNTIKYTATIEYSAPTVSPITNLGNKTTKTGSTASNGTATWISDTAEVTTNTTFIGVYPIYYGTVSSTVEPNSKKIANSNTFVVNFNDETDSTRIAFAYPSTMSISKLGVYNSISKSYDYQTVEEYGSISNSTITSNGTTYKVWRRTGENFITSPQIEITFNKKTSEE